MSPADDAPTLATDPQHSSYSFLLAANRGGGSLLQRATSRHCSQRRDGLLLRAVYRLPSVPMSSRRLVFVLVVGSVIRLVPLG